MVNYLSEFIFGELSLSVILLSSTLANYIFVSYLSEFSFGEIFLSVTPVSLTLVSYLCQLPQ